MLQAVVRVAATADDCALRVHNNGAYAWIGRGQSDISPGQVKGSAEEEFVRIARCSHSRSIISSRRQGRTEKQTIRLGPSRQKRSVRVFLRFGDGCATATLGTTSDWNQPVRVRICRWLWLAADTAPQIPQKVQCCPPAFRIAHKQFLILCPSKENHANNESTKSLALKGSRSPAFSPTPT
jgi:hypothetical protein